MRTYTPVPDSVTFWGLPAALSLTPKAALRLVPVIAIPVMFNVVVPPFVNVTVLAAVVASTLTEPKLTLVGESLAAVPIPLSGTRCGLPAALSVTLRAALRVPLAVGLKVTLEVQLVRHVFSFGYL